MRRLTEALLTFALVVATVSTCLAQGIFGKNKVVYADRDWQVFEEGMVHLYFYPEEEPLARQTLSIARAAYREFSVYFDYEFEEPIPIILYGTHHDFKQTHVTPGFIPEGTAGFTEFAKGRVAVRATGSYAELAHLVRHELVHAFMLAKLAHVMSERQLYDYGAPPLWFIEGLAENVARPHPDVEAEMFLRDAVLHDGLVPIPRLWEIAGTFLMYKEGESIVGYLRSQYGDRVPIMLLERWWNGRDFEAVLEEELGLDLVELDAQWRTYLKRRYFPQMLARQLPAEKGEALWRPGRFETASAFLAHDEDGVTRVATISARGGTLSLYELELRPGQSARSRLLVEGGRNARFESLPAFRSQLDAHDGRLIAFVAKNGGQDALYIYDRHEDNIAHVYATDGLRQISSPSFSPDGSRVVFSGLSLDGYTDLYVVELASGALTRVTHDIFDDVHPTWHPSADEIVFASDRGAYVEGTHALYRLTLQDDRQPVALTTTLASAATPRYSPSGHEILYVSDASGTRNLHLLRGDTDHQLTNVTGGVYLPDWIPANGDDPDRFVTSVYHSRGFSLYAFDEPENLRASPVRTELLAAPWSDSPAQTEVAAVARDYDVDMSLDFVQSVVALDPDLPYGSGASLGFTDLLGDHQLFVYGSSAADDFSLENLNVGVSYSNLSRRWNRHFGLFRIHTQQRLISRPTRNESRVGGFAGVTYPLSVFDRVEFSTVFRYLDREFSPIVGRPGNSWLWSFFTSYVQDNSLWTWNGPARGRRFNLTLGQTFDLRGRGFDRQTIQGDLRMYQPVLGSSVLAQRLLVRQNFGGDSQLFYLGGPNDLRGYRWFAFGGDRVLFVSTEYRFPILDGLALRFPFGRFDFPNVRGALFNDMGRVDGDPFPTDQWLGSFGYSFYMTLIPPLAFRLDVVKVHDFDEVDPWDPRLSLSFLF